MADGVILSNDVAGYSYRDTRFEYAFVSETSVHGTSGTRYALGAWPSGFGSGKVVEFGLGVVAPATSASGFVSGTVDATLRINSVAVCSTVPAIAMAGSAGQSARITTNASTTIQQALATSGIVNTASAQVNPGDQISMDFNARSVGSAAAGAAGVGLYAWAVIRVQSH